jgi:hypothetical protein
MSEIEKCPKCDAEIEKGKRILVYGGIFRLAKKDRSTFSPSSMSDRHLGFCARIFLSTSVDTRRL